MQQHMQQHAAAERQRAAGMSPGPSGLRSSSVPRLTARGAQRIVMPTGQQGLARQRDKWVPLPEGDEDTEPESLPAPATGSVNSTDGVALLAAAMAEAHSAGEDALQVSLLAHAPAGAGHVRHGPGTVGGRQRLPHPCCRPSPFTHSLFACMPFTPGPCSGTWNL